MAEARPYVSRRLSGAPGAVVDEVRAHLDDGEELLAAVAVAKVFPPLDVVVVTPWRVLAGMRRQLDDEGWRVRLAREDVAEVEVTGFMDNVRFVMRDGSEVKVGNLIDAHDERPLREALGLPVTEPEPRESDASEGPVDELSSLDDLLAGPDTETEAAPQAPAATWELYDPPPPAHHRHRRR